MSDEDDFPSWYPAYVEIRKKAQPSKNTFNVTYLKLMKEYHKNRKFLEADFGIEKYDHWYYYYARSCNALLSCAKISNGNLELTNNGSFTEQEFLNYSYAVKHRTNHYPIVGRF